VPQSLLGRVDGVIERPLLAPSGSREERRELPVLKAKRTSARPGQITAVDPQRSFTLHARTLTKTPGVDLPDSVTDGPKPKSRHPLVRSNIQSVNSFDFCRNLASEKTWNFYNEAYAGEGKRLIADCMRGRASR